MRVHYVNKARKSKKSRSCRHCSHVVEPGESYKWAEPRYGGLMYWCKDHSPRRSELTSSKVGPLYDAQDMFDPSNLETVDDIREALQEIADQAREIGEEYTESIENMPESLQDTSPAAEQMREYIDELESYADTLESWDPSVDPDDEEEFDEDAARTEAEAEVTSELEDNNKPGPEDDGFDEAEFTSLVDDRVNSAREEFEDNHEGEEGQSEAMQTIKDEAQDAVMELGL
jgi:hypothetical protein